MIVILVVDGDSSMNRICMRTYLQTCTCDCLHEYAQAFQRMYDNISRMVR